MNQIDLKAFAQLWAGMAEMYGKTISDAGIGMAFAALMKFDLPDIRRAINAHIADPINGRFMAKPADLILHMDGDPESRALQAWTQVENAIGRVGPYASVVFDDPRIMISVEDMGGWLGLCDIQNEEMPFKRTEFVKRYKGYLNRASVRHPPKLIGLTEANNRSRGVKYEQSPVLIGNPERAKLILESGSTETQQITSLDQLLARMPDRLKISE